jgi:hypothetical protein
METQGISTHSYTPCPSIAELRTDIDKLLQADAVSPQFRKKLTSILCCLDIAAAWTLGSEYLDDVQQTIGQTLEELRRAENLPQPVDQRVFQISNLLACQKIFNQSQEPVSLTANAQNKAASQP